MKISKKYLQKIISEEIKNIFEQEEAETAQNTQMQPSKEEEGEERNQINSQIIVLRKQLEIAKEQIKSIPRQIEELNKKLLNL
jgi:hypothetical protein